jgi:subtilase family serine protease
MLGSMLISPVANAERFEVTLVLRRRRDGPPFPSIDELGAQPPLQRKYLSRAEFAAKFGADPADVDQIRRFATTLGLEIQNQDLAQRKVTVTGTATQFSAAFATSFGRFLWSGQTFRAPIGPLSLPNQLSQIVTAVLGLDERPAARPMLARHPGFWSVADILQSHTAANLTYSQYLSSRGALVNHRIGAALANEAVSKNLGQRSSTPFAHSSTMFATTLLTTVKVLSRINDIVTGFGGAIRDVYDGARRAAFLAALNTLGIKTPPQVAELYDFPAGTDGTGECIAIIELGGGYRADMLSSYFDVIGVETPVISNVSVLSGANAPGICEPYDSEVCLDIDVIGGAAPGARLVCYFAPLTAVGMIEAVRSAIHDDKNNPSVISLSWSLSEAYWLGAPMYVRYFEEVLQEAALLGVTVCVAAGDYGATSEFHDGAAWVNYPASSPCVLSCGGTSLYVTGGKIVYEPVWNSLYACGQATGGGVSQMFSVPAWQSTAEVPRSISPGGGAGRGVPDVAGNADPFTGYLVQVNGMFTVIAGTSAVAPLWAALIARTNQQLGTRVGYINPLLYRIRGPNGFRDILVGDNGGYSARTGWDPCTGWGSPNGNGFCNGLRVA